MVGGFDFLQILHRPERVHRTRCLTGHYIRTAAINASFVVRDRTHPVLRRGRGTFSARAQPYRAAFQNDAGRYTKDHWQFVTKRQFSGAAVIFCVTSRIRVYDPPNQER
jgi:hypothetical protein